MIVDIERHDAIRRRLHAKGVKFTDIATEVGCSRGLVTMVSQGRRSHRDIENAISRHLREDPKSLWPFKHFQEAYKS